MTVCYEDHQIIYLIPFLQVTAEFVFQEVNGVVSKRIVASLTFK